jgi:hypothetical protein
VCVEQVQIIIELDENQSSDNSQLHITSKEKEERKKIKITNENDKN